ncbi:hypothetical protein Q9Q95_11120 [Sphingomonas sp. DG1-23]|uniref:hypothetical protein n=1 Tax=Sphingomonas sp. DG1-23 TaxID=3068316 RepID=UPI00273D69F2|nr:hypothetical protein [Sphingomonas sp. DG1-23]MDP5279474.1 hypothetical protein [Sphingomonas sp. DG1-23]
MADDTQALATETRNGHIDLKRSFPLENRYIGGACDARPSLIRLPRQTLPQFTVSIADGDRLRPQHGEADRIDYRIPANGSALPHR